MAVATASLITLGLTAASTGASIYAQNQQAKGQAAVANYNANAADIAAQQKNLEGRQNVQRAQINKESILARNRVRLAAQGTVVDSGAPLEIGAAMASRLQLDVLDAYQKADNERSTLLQQAEIQKYQGAQAIQAGKLNMAGTLLGGLTKIGTQGYSSYRSGSLLTS